VISQKAGDGSTFSGHTPRDGVAAKTAAAAENILSCGS